MIRAFEIPEEQLVQIVEQDIVAHAPTEKQDTVREVAWDIMESWGGCERDALVVLHHATQQGKFDEYAEKLDDFYNQHLQYVMPEARRNTDILAVWREQQITVGYLKELGAEPVTPLPEQP